MELVLRKLDLVRDEQGWALFMSRDRDVSMGFDRCGCGKVASRKRAAGVSLAAWGKPLPDIRIGLCERCYAGIWKREAWLVGGVIGTVLGGVGAAWLVMMVWPWVPWVLLVGVSMLGILGSWALIVGISSQLRFTKGWRGVPVKVVTSNKNGWVLETDSVLVAEVWEANGGARVARKIVERDYVLAVWTGLGVMLFVAGVLWFAWHPIVRLVNITQEPLEVLVDGRSMGVIVGIPGEAPGGGKRVRLPKGRRSFRAMGLDGESVDETTGWVGQGKAEFYAPGSKDRCFWVSQRAYGRVVQPKPETVWLNPNRSFHSLPFAVDGWFQPNPVAKSSVWFSGGVRRTVRQGLCSR